jgi:hypothetical protein
MVIEFDLDWAFNANWSQRKNDYLVIDNDPDSDAPTVPRDVLLRDPDSDGVSFRATLNDQLVLTNSVSLVTINDRGGTTKPEILSVSGGPTKVTPQPRSTGLLTGGEIVAGTIPASEFTVETGSGVIWDGTTDPATPTLTDTITWAEFTDETTIGTETFVYITSAGALNLSASRTPALDRSHILLGLVIDSGTSLTIINAPITANQIGSYLSDLYAEIGIMINDVVISPNADLTVQNSAGTAFGQSVNWHTDRTTPNQIAIAANDPMPMTYVTQDGDVAASTVTNMDVGNYNPTGNTISAIGGGVRNSTNQRIYITPFGFATLYGQNIFSSLDAAVDGADTENPVTPEWLLNYGTLLVTVSVIRTATDLSDDTEAKFNYSAAGGSAGDNHDHSRLDSPDGLLVSVVQTTNAGDVEILDDLVHSGDTDTLISFTDDAMTLEAGGLTMLTLTEAVQDLITLGPGSGDVDIDFNDDMFLQGSNGAFGIGVNPPEESFHVVTGNVIPALFESSNTGGTQVIYRNSAAASTSLVNDFVFKQQNTTPAEFTAAAIRITANDVTAGTEDTVMDFRTVVAGTLTKRMRIRNGDVIIGEGTLPASRLEVETPSTYGKQAVTIDQNDADQAFIDFQGSSGAGVSFNINTTERNTFQAMLMIEINGTKYWLKAFQ